MNIKVLNIKPDLQKKIISLDLGKIKKEYKKELKPVKKGIFIHCPSNFKIPQPLKIKIDLSSSFSPFLIFIKLEPKSQLKLYIYLKNPTSLKLKKIVYLKKESTLTLVNVHNLESKMDYKEDVTQEKNTHFANFHFYFNKFNFNFSQTINLSQKKSSLNNYILNFTQNKGRFNLIQNIYHSAFDTSSYNLTRCLLKDQSLGSYKGKVHIKPLAKKSESLLACHSLLLSLKAQIQILPSLKVENQYVKVSHSASTMPLDPEQLFYLQSRALSSHQAKRVLIYAFFNDILKSKKIEEEKNYILKKINKFF